MNSIEQKDFLRSCKTRPEFFVENIVGEQWWDKQIEIANAVLTHKRVAVPSGHGNGKSHLAGKLALQFGATHPDSIVITTAPTERQVRKVLWGEIHSAYNKARYPIGGELLTRELKWSPDHYMLGLTTKEPDKFQGFHPKSGHILVIIDEASGVPLPIWEAIEGIMTSPYAHCLAIGNPLQGSGPFYKACTEGNWHVIQLSCMDNPNVKTGKIIYPGLTTREWVMEKAAEWGENSNLFKSRVLGEFPQEGENTLIPLHWIMQAVNNPNLVDVEPTGTFSLGVDVARHGTDRTVLQVRQGAHVHPPIYWQGKDTMETVGRTIQTIRKHNINPVHVWVDDGGVGGGVVDRLREQNYHVRAIAFGSSPGNKSRFVDWKSEAFYRLRTEFEHGMICLPHHDRLIGDLASLEVEDRSDGRIKMVPKFKMKRAGLDSPDFADALMLASQRELQIVQKPQFTKEKLSSWQMRSMSPGATIRRHQRRRKRWKGVSCT